MLSAYVLQDNCKRAEGWHQNKVYMLPRHLFSPRPRIARFACRVAPLHLRACSQAWLNLNLQSAIKHKTIKKAKVANPSTPLSRKLLKLVQVYTEGGDNRIGVSYRLKPLRENTPKMDWRDKNQLVNLRTNKKAVRLLEELEVKLSAPTARPCHRSKSGKMC